MPASFMPPFMRWRGWCSSVSQAGQRRFTRLRIVSKCYLRALMIFGRMSSPRVYALVPHLDLSAFFRPTHGTTALLNCVFDLKPSWQIPALCHSAISAAVQSISTPGQPFSRTSIFQEMTYENWPVTNDIWFDSERIQGSHMSLVTGQFSYVI